MQDLVLEPGPALIARRWQTDDDSASGRWKELNVTDRGHEYLFAHVTRGRAVTPGDIFRLLEASPVLKQVFQRDFVEDLCDEARKGPVAMDATEATSPEGIEFLELYPQWCLDTSTRTYTATQRLHLHGVGVGFELEADAPDYYRRKGERIH